jgi:hypothetical protein
MSYTLYGGLSTSADPIEVADFWEIECLKKTTHSVSLLDINKERGISDDVQETETELYEDNVEEGDLELVREIERRIKSCSGKYPFKLDSSGYVLTIDGNVDQKYLWIYTYLLLATRNDMSKNKVFGDIDGTKIFESLSKDSLLNYLGENSVGIVFGTAKENGFYEKLNDLVKNMNEGRLHPKDDALTYSPQDDKVDIVAWIPFHDSLPSKIICFAQCKTGTHWLGAIAQLRTSSFLKRWFSLDPSVDPIESFMITDILNPSDFYNRATDNLFLDRCRIACFSALRPENEWFDNLKKWTEGIMNQYTLSFQ